MGQTVPRLRRWIVITWTSRANNTLRSHTDLAAQNLSLHRHRFSSLRFRLLPLGFVHAAGFFREQIAQPLLAFSPENETDKKGSRKHRDWEGSAGLLWEQP